MLSKYGQVSAIEMDETAREIANQKTKGKFDIKAGCCPSQIPFVQEKFDLICLFDVLEHIPDDIGTLNKLKELLAPGGRIFITVPAHPWLWGAHDQYLHHQRRYRAAQFREMLIDTGYRIRKYTYFNTLLFPFAALVRIKERLTSSKVAGGGAVPVAPLNALFRQLFGFEAYILPRINLPYGVSLMAIIDAAPDANEKSSIDAK